MSHITALFCSKGCGSKFKNVEPLERHESVCDFKAPTASGMATQTPAASGMASQTSAASVMTKSFLTVVV